MFPSVKEFEDTKVVIRNCKLKDRLQWTKQDNDLQNTTPKTKD